VRPGIPVLQGREDVNVYYLWPALSSLFGCSDFEGTHIVPLTRYGTRYTDELRRLLRG
jgi:hypothetical protein